MEFGQVAVLLVLTLLNGFLSMAELALVSARRVRLQTLIQSGKGAGVAAARAALRLMDRPARLLSTVQVGITLISVFSGAYGAAELAQPVADALTAYPWPWVAEHAQGLAFALVGGGIAWLTLVLGELVPKQAALAHPERLAMWAAWPMTVLVTLAAPLAMVLEAPSRLILRLLSTGTRKGPAVTEEEVHALIREGARHGVILPVEHQMLEGVLRLTDRTARSLMTPRPDMVWIDVDSSPEAQRQALLASPHSHLPVGRQDLREILGIVHARDLMQDLAAGRLLEVRRALREPLIVPDGTPVLRLLDIFRQSGQHVAVLVDEYGSVEGLVTPTDILTAIAGDLPEPGQGDEPMVVRREDGTWLVEGLAPIETIEAQLSLRGLREPDEDFHTLAGFMLARLGHVPQTGESLIWNQHRFEIVDMDGRRIDKILVGPIPVAKS
ncbi:MAG: HlyC/CorC family transporter [Alphaproteobacteria bacterium]|nr:MAG: HlyC/CorC family transporter [Alphaproteobacteria bacterium]